VYYKYLKCLNHALRDSGLLYLSPPERESLFAKQIPYVGGVTFYLGVNFFKPLIQNITDESYFISGSKLIGILGL
jgi:hypothetical protein